MKKEDTICECVKVSTWKKNEKPNRTIISNKTRKTQLLMLAETEKYQNIKTICDKKKSLKKSKPSRLEERKKC